VKTFIRIFPLFLPLVASSCGQPSPPAAAPPVAASAVPMPPASATVPTLVSDPKAPPKNPWFENRGGMWMPSQMAGHAEMLKKLGLTIDPALLSDPLSPLLSSVISLGGCSASFVSPDGLVITNHHCATGALQLNSTAKANLLKDGYMAPTRAAEKSNGPSARAFVTRKVTNVTNDFQKALASKTSDLQMANAIEGVEKSIVAACEKGRPGIKCSVARFYNGAEFYLIEQLEIRDLRLVYAPAAGIGNYGGEIDNWRWPRHTGDFTFFRAYVGKDGNPADYSPENVPYRPQHHLKIATTPLAEGDLVMVAGYPGRTQLLRTLAEAEQTVSWLYPRRVKMAEEYLAMLKEVGDRDGDVAVRATPFVRRFGNGLTNTKGQLEGLIQGGLLAEKKADEDQLRAFIAKTPQNKLKFGTAIDDIKKAVDENAKYREADASLRGEILMPKLMSAANTIVRMAEELPKNDSDRDPEFQERKWPDLKNAMETIDKQYHVDLDKALLRLALERALRAPEAERTKAVEIICGPNPTKQSIAKAVDELYGTSSFHVTANRIEYLMKASPAVFKKLNDPIINLMIKLRPILRESEEREKAFTAKLAQITPRYIAALRAFRGTEIAPDANSTLRLTYGVVRGYTPKNGAPLASFTHLDGMLAKNTGKDPFVVPPRLLQAVKEGKLGGYTEHTMPVDYVSTLHITGGNSGSATLNANGELVGLAFDGNYESVASDWLYVPSVTRSIHVDIRYVLWLLANVDGGAHLLAEMGVAK